MSRRYRIAVHVVPRQGILDPQGQAVADALHALGFPEVGTVHAGRHLVLDVTAPGEAEARERVTAMCRTLLANPVTEDFEIASVGAAP